MVFNILRLIFILFVVCCLTQEALSQEFVVTGEVHRPQSNSLDEELGVSVTIYGYSKDSPGRLLEFSESVSVVIAAGLESSEFSLPITPRTDVYYQVTYHCQICLSRGVVDSGFYSGDNMVFLPEDAARLSFEELLSPINVNLLGTVTVVSRIVKPTGFPVDKAVSFGLRVGYQDSSGLYDYLFLREIRHLSISSGETEREVAFNVPDVPELKFRLSYSCYLCDGVWSGGYYTPSGTAVNPNLVQGLPYDSLPSPLSFELVGLKTVTGVIRQPSAKRLNEPWSLRAVIRLYDADGFNYATATSAAVYLFTDADSVDFNVDLPVFTNATDEYDVQYTTDSGFDENISTTGFLGENGKMVLDYQDSSRFELSNLDSPIVLEMINRVLISGRMFFSDEISLKTDTIVHLTAVNSTSSRTLESLLIRAVPGYKNFTMYLPFTDNNNYKLFYSCADSGCELDGINRIGYYATDNSVYDEDEAEEVATSLDETFVELSLLPLDSDGDNIPNLRDNCPDDLNADQANLDGDGFGNACDSDIDGDGVFFAIDIDDYDRNLCGLDIDVDGCDDCLSGRNNPSDDGEDLDGDGVCTYTAEICFPIVTTDKKSSLVCM